MLDTNALKARQQAAWASGDYAVIGTTLQLVGERLAEACDLRWDEQVLDAAAALENDLTQLLNESNLAGASSLVVPSDYLEVVIMKR